MGERKGTNKYYPPDYDPRKGGLNKWQGTHALRERARKVHLGIIIIRFEMPYNIWCEGCNNHIGMGVRYNAEKKKIGMYYSTPVYEFKMKCHLCDNHFVIKTDPANLDYIIISGARRQENRWDPTKNEQVVPETKETQKKLFDDSMFKLEHGTEDTNKAENLKPFLVKLYDRNEDNWADSYTANSRLRKEFREQNKKLQESANRDTVLLSKSSLGIPLLPEREEDRKMASLLSMKLKPTQDITKNTDLLRKRLLSSSALPCRPFSVAKEKKTLRLLDESASKNIKVIKKAKIDSGSDQPANSKDSEGCSKGKITDGDESGKTLDSDLRIDCNTRQGKTFENNERGEGSESELNVSESFTISDDDSSNAEVDRNKSGNEKEKKILNSLVAYGDSSSTDSD